MLYPTVNLLFDDESLTEFQKLSQALHNIYIKLNKCYAKIEEIDDDYDKKIIDKLELSTIRIIVEEEIEEYNRQIELIEAEEYKLFDNLETLM